MNTQPGETTEEALRLILAHKAMLKSYIHCIMQDARFTDEIFSAATDAILSSWDRYEDDRPFPLWARGVTRRVALARVRKEAHQPIAFSPDVLERIAEQMECGGTEAEFEDRTEALHKCLERLPQRHRSLVHLRYWKKASYEELSSTIGKAVPTLYVIFNRVHDKLGTCVKRELKQP